MSDVKIAVCGVCGKDNTLQVGRFVGEVHCGDCRAIDNVEVITVCPHGICSQYYCDTGDRRCQKGHPDYEVC